MKTILSAVLIFVLIVLLFIAILKHHNCFNNYDRIAMAIYYHNIAEIWKGHKENVIDYWEVMEPYGKTYRRWWDWGCRHIVDDDTYKLIEPYLED